jgi:ssDNA-binding Zn-finger/Zn-ribbon topoisomerase 1
MEKGANMSDHDKEEREDYRKCLKCGKKIYADEIKYFDNNTKTICPHCGVTMSIYIDNKETDKVRMTIFKRIIKDV